MTLDEFIDLRRALRLSQSEMATAMGMSLRAYSAIETGEARLRRVHKHSAERIAMLQAIEQRDPMLVPNSVRAQCSEIYLMATGLRA